MKLTTKRLILRDLKKSDKKDVQQNANNIKIAKWIPPFPHPYSIKDANSYIKSCMKNSKQKPRENYDFGITLKLDNRVMGMISISKVDKFQGTGTVGYWLGENYWRNGYMEEATKEVINFAFKNLKLRRIEVSVYSDNNPSSALIKKMGFKYEGTRIKQVRDRATKKIHDHDFYGMLRKDWKKSNKNL